MRTLVLPLRGYEALPAPGQARSAPGPSPRNRGLSVVIVGVVASVVAVSAWDAVRQVGRIIRAPAMLPAENTWTEARITRLEPRSMQLTTRDGRTEELALDFAYTSVFQEGGVLSIAHLRLGQQLQVLSGRHAGVMTAKAIELTPLHPLP